MSLPRETLEEALHFLGATEIGLAVTGAGQLRLALGGLQPLRRSNA